MFSHASIPHHFVEGKIAEPEADIRPLGYKLVTFPLQPQRLFRNFASGDVLQRSSAPDQLALRPVPLELWRAVCLNPPLRSIRSHNAELAPVRLRTKWIHRLLKFFPHATEIIGMNQLREFRCAS